MFKQTSALLAPNKARTECKCGQLYKTNNKISDKNANQKMYFNPHIVLFSSMVVGCVIGIMCGIGGVL